MDPVIKPWVDLWDYLDGNFWHLCRWAEKSLSAKEVAWQPVADVASIGWNLQHLGEMLDYYLAFIFRHSPPVQSDLPTMRSGSKDDGRFGDVAAIADYHCKLRPIYRDFLCNLTADNFERVIERQGKRDFTYAWAVGHIAEHESYHLGKCMLLRTLLAHR